MGRRTVRSHFTRSCLWAALNFSSTKYREIIFRRPRAETNKTNTLTKKQQHSKVPTKIKEKKLLKMIDDIAFNKVAI